MHEDSFRQALKQRLDGVRFPEEGRLNVLHRIKGENKVTKKLSTGLILAFVLMALTLTALALSQAGLLDFLIGNPEKASMELKDSMQLIDTTEEFDHIRIRITGAAYDGEKLAISWESQNLNPQEPAMLSMRSVTAGGEDIWPNFSAFDGDWLPMLFGLQEEGFDRQKVSGGMVGLAAREQLTGQVPVEVKVAIQRPTGPLMVVDVSLYPQEGENEDDKAFREERMALVKETGLAIAPHDQLNPKTWINKGYVPVDDSGQIFGHSEQQGNALYTEYPGLMKDAGIITLTFTLDADRGLALVRDLVPRQRDIKLKDCTVRINRLSLSPLTTRMDIDLIPHDGTAESALILQERYGNISPTTKGKNPAFADMEFESAGARRQLKDGSWAYHVDILYPGLNVFPDSITLSPRWDYFGDRRDDDISAEDMKDIEAFEKALTLKIE
jgi:hypothetical protein